MVDRPFNNRGSDNPDQFSKHPHGDAFEALGAAGLVEAEFLEQRLQIFLGFDSCFTPQCKKTAKTRA